MPVLLYCTNNHIILQCSHLLSHTYCPTIYHCHDVMHEDVSKSFWTGHLEQELQMVQRSPTKYSCITILWASLVSFAAITLCVATQLVLLL